MQCRMYKHDDCCFPFATHGAFTVVETRFFITRFFFCCVLQDPPPGAATIALRVHKPAAAHHFSSLFFVIRSSLSRRRRISLCTGPDGRLARIHVRRWLRLASVGHSATWRCCCCCCNRSVISRQILGAVQTCDRRWTSVCGHALVHQLTFDARLSAHTRRFCSSELSHPRRRVRVCGRSTSFDRHVRAPRRFRVI